MNLQTFLTVLVIGALVGLFATLSGKNGKNNLVLNLVVAAAGSLLGWLLFGEISRTALQVLFAIGGSLVLLALLRLIKK